jgi:hypothetical protein
MIVASPTWSVTGRLNRISFKGLLVAVSGLDSELQRVVFSPEQSPSSILGPRDFHGISFAAQTLKPALLASGFISFDMQPIHSIPDRPSASYRDGGLIDCHIEPSSAGGIGLMQHFSHHIIPGWLDKFVLWRRSRHADNVLLLSPSSTWFDRGRERKVPDRRDFHRYGNNNDGCIRAWSEIAAAAEKRLISLLSGYIGEIVGPI